MFCEHSKKTFLNQGLDVWIKMAKGRREFTHDVVQHFLTDSADPQLLFGQRFFRFGRLLGGGMNLMDGHTSIV